MAVVVGVDGSADSLSAVDWAAGEAVARHQPLRVVHAFVWPLLNVPLGAPPGSPPGSGLRNQAEHVVADAVARAHAAAPDLEVTGELPVNRPAAALVEASTGASVAVVASRGLGGITGRLVGSVGTHLADHARCPVLVVRPSRAPDGPVLVGVEESPPSLRALEFAAWEAWRTGAGLVAVHVRPHGPAGDEVGALDRRLADVREHHPGVGIVGRVEVGRPGRVLVKESAGARLVVVGSRARGGVVAGLREGSARHGVLYRARCPVAMVPPDTP